MDEKTVRKIDGKLDGNLFRNRSHFIEYSVRKVLGEKG